MQLEKIQDLLSAEVLADLRRYDTPTIANAMETLDLSPPRSLSTDLRIITAEGAPMVGLAVTGTMSPQRGGKFEHLEGWLRFLESIEECPLPTVAIIRDDSPQPGGEAMIGEGMSLSMKVCGAAGAICGGAVRDVSQVRALDFPVLATGVTADRGRIRFHRYQVPVEVGGILIRPGELIHADENGGIVLPADRAADIARAAAAVADKEAAIFAVLREPGLTVARLRQMYGEALSSAERERMIHE